MTEYLVQTKYLNKNYFHFFRQEEGKARQQGSLHQQDVPSRRLRHPRPQKSSGRCKVEAVPTFSTSHPPPTPIRCRWKARVKSLPPSLSFFLLFRIMFKNFRKFCFRNYRALVDDGWDTARLTFTRIWNVFSSLQFLTELLDCWDKFLCE